MKGHVLIVDDDEEILAMTRLLLSGSGFDVRTAPDGETALDRIEAEAPALVLLDINMPGLDGWEVLRMLKQDEQRRDVPVFMFSVNYEIREKLHAMQLGAADYITKPFDTEQLLRRVGEVVGDTATRDIR